MNPKISKPTLIEEYADVCMDSLIIISFVRIVLFQKFFIVGKLNFFVVTFIFIALLLSKSVATVLRAGVSAYSLYLFFAEISEGTVLFNYTLSLLATYFGLYFIFRKALLKKNISVEVVSNCLALAIFTKLLYSYFVQIQQYLPYSLVKIVSVIIIIMLSNSHS